MFFNKNLVKNTIEERQTRFLRFHDAIKLNNLDENAELRKKRDLLLEEIRNYLTENKLPTFIHLNQGSYAMGTGIKGETYDIDVALMFNIAKKDYDPVKVKSWIDEALSKASNRTITWKYPCVRVEYAKGYDVDLACFSAADYNKPQKDYLAYGKKHSVESEKEWKESNPRALITLVNDSQKTTDDLSQMKRIIRYLKRWRDLKFNAGGNARPTGIALTACCLKWFCPAKDNDFKALQALVGDMLANFNKGRLSVKLSIPPANDLFEKMTDNQMTAFKDNLQSLSNHLEEAFLKTSIDEACAKLRKVFGTDFPES